ALGREVTALDLSADMLALLRQQLDRAPAHLRERCTVVQADMADFRLPRRYAVIVLGTTSISLLDRAGRAGLYRCVAEHLADGGRFFLTTLDRGADSPEEEVE
ncbi:class I SAM-dependent methyltransferase, partial [Algoriphagus aestuarii]|nr:class I SAM-dependent methyltransferase [Algoriphagus aestuarii]